VKRVLIVDDCSHSAHVPSCILESAGYAVEEAWNGIEALEKALERPSILSSGYQHPKLDGFCFCASCANRTLPVTRHHDLHRSRRRDEGNCLRRPAPIAI